MFSVLVKRYSAQKTRHVANLVQVYMVVAQFQMLFVVLTESTAALIAIFAISQLEVVLKTDKFFC